MVKSRHDRAYTSPKHSVEHGEVWVSDAATPTLQGCAGGLVLLVRVLPRLHEPEREFVFGLIDATRRSSGGGKILLVWPVR
eukprot:8557599-Alexandrium_andersonii.AAC.1